MLNSDIIRVLLASADLNEMRPLVLNIFTFVVSASKERSQSLCTYIVTLLENVNKFSHNSGGDSRLILHGVKCIFRGASILCSVEDEFVEWRTDVVMSNLIAFIQGRAHELVEELANSSSDAQSHHICDSFNWIVIDAFVLLLPRFQRHCQPIRLWLRDNEGCVDFVTLPLERASLLQISQAQHILRSLQVAINHGTEYDSDTYYDSDDDESLLVGRRISVEWTGGKKYFGSVTAFDTTTRMHQVRYDDGDIRSYELVSKSPTRGRVVWDLVFEK